MTEERPYPLRALNRALHIAWEGMEQAIEKNPTNYRCKDVVDAFRDVITAAKELARFEAPTMQSVAVREDRNLNIFLTTFDAHGQPVKECIREHKTH